MKVWVKTETHKEGKYLVLRRDGTRPSWPHFVIGGDDPQSPAALRGYAAKAEENGLDAEYVQSVRELADEWEKRTGGKADPASGPHRVDNPFVIQMMRGLFDLTEYRRWNPHPFTTQPDGQETCDSCSERGKQHTIIEVSVRPCDGSGMWPAGVPQHVRLCDCCGRTTGPWVKEEHVNAGL
jgi:hypothetical protein